MQTENYTQLANAIKEQLFDQDEAVESLSQALLQSDIISSKNGVRAIFTLIGPSNSGKHYLCELLEKNSANIDDIKTFYMDQYSDLQGISENVNGDFFKNEIIAYVAQHPKTILVFEDFEQADLQVQLQLYTLLSDYEKSEVDFSNVIVIFTTTLLSSLLQRKELKTLIQEEPIQAHTFIVEKLAQEQLHVLDGTEKAFNAKLLSLINEHTIIPLNKLSLQSLLKIGALTLQNITQNFMQEKNITITYSDCDTFASLLTLSLSPYLNARYIKQKIPKLIFNYLYEALKTTEEINQIEFKVSKKAKLFLEDIFADEEQFYSNIKQHHKIITLQYKIKTQGLNVRCSIQNALYTDEKLSVTAQDAFQTSEVTFQDVAGHKKVKKELSEIISLLKNPKRLKRFDLDIPKGMFLYGPVGMGKKLLARAFAHEANMPYTTISGSDLFDAQQIKNAYVRAYKNAPSIVIFEDIDTQGFVGGMLSTMSVEPIIDALDSIKQSFDAPIFTILTLTSNEFPPELLQAERINLQIEVPKLDMEARRFFIENILKKPHDTNIDIERVVRYISGMGGDELQRIGQEASLYAARKGLKELNEEILLEQINIIKYGSKIEAKQIRDIETSMAKTAYHEAGHAVISYTFLPNTKIEQVTVAPRSDSLGFVSYHSDDYVDALSKQELFYDVCVGLAGRIAKMEKFGETGGMETGAVSDLDVATTQVYAAIAMFGMDEELGYINVSSLDVGAGNMLFQEKIEERILVWLDRAKTFTEREVKRLWSAIDAVAQALIEKEVIDGEELKEIIDSATNAQ